MAGGRASERTWSELTLISVGAHRPETLVADQGSAYIADAYWDGEPVSLAWR